MHHSGTMMRRGVGAGRTSERLTSFIQRLPSLHARAIFHHNNCKILRSKDGCTDVPVHGLTRVPSQVNAKENREPLKCTDL